MEKISFGTGGFRGIIGEDFNLLNVSLIAEAISKMIEEDKEKREVVVGYDRRFFSKEAAETLASVFLSHKIRVNLLSSESPSPVVMYYVRKFATPYGCMVTASHNPAAFNGVKVFTRGGFDAGVEVTDRLEKTISSLSSYPSVSFDMNDPNLRIFEGIEEYVDNILQFSLFPIDSSLKIAYENLNGAGIVSIDRLFKKLKMPLTSFHVEKDSSFRGKIPNPLEENLQELKSHVLSNGYDFGFACDSDADRLGIIDEKGNYVSPNEILAVCYYYLVKETALSGDIVKNFVTSNLLDLLASKLGYRCHVVDVGFKNITHGMQVFDAVIGGESSGGLTVKGYIPGKDSTFSIMLFLSAVSKLGKPVSEIVKMIKEFAGYDCIFGEYSLSYSRKNSSSIREYLDSHEPKFDMRVLSSERFNRNYKWIFSSDEWLSIRLSDTEPVIRVSAEMKNHEILTRELTALKRYIAPLGK